jgi:hypothetical protein
MDPDAVPAYSALAPDALCATAAQRATAFHAFHSLGVARAGQGMPKVGANGAELRRWWTPCPTAWAEGRVGAWEPW